MLLFEKYGQDPPLNRQAERFGREGMPYRKAKTTTRRKIIAPSIKRL